MECKQEDPKDAFAITLGHEFGHAIAAKDNLQRYTEEKEAPVSEQQTIPYENKIREELKKIEEKHRRRNNEDNTHCFF